jgi:hypothetical protein
MRRIAREGAALPRPSGDAWQLGIVALLCGACSGASAPVDSGLGAADSFSRPRDAAALDTATIRDGTVNDGSAPETMDAGTVAGDAHCVTGYAACHPDAEPRDCCPGLECLVPLVPLTDGASGAVCVYAMK